MEKRFWAAMAVYLVLFILAFLLLNGIIQKATLLALGLFTVKTLIAFKAQR